MDSPPRPDPLPICIYVPMCNNYKAQCAVVLEPYDWPNIIHGIDF